jgi:hypothetical protein
MAVNGLDFIQVGGTGYQYAVVNWHGQLTHNRQAGVLQQIVNVIDGPGTGVFQWARPHNQPDLFQPD